MDSKERSDYSSLNIEELIAIAWLRTLSENDFKHLPSVLAMFEQSHHSLDFRQTYATSYNVQQRFLSIA